MLLSLPFNLKDNNGNDISEMLTTLGIEKEDNVFIVDYKTGEVINKTLKTTSSGKALYIYAYAKTTEN